jgi:hypothetical protein
MHSIVFEKFYENFILRAQARNYKNAVPGLQFPARLVQTVQSRDHKGANPMDRKSVTGCHFPFSAYHSGKQPIGDLDGFVFSPPAQNEPALDEQYFLSVFKAAGGAFPLRT